MDRIAALRNVEEALSAFERGELSLGTLEERVLGVLRTYATEFDADGLRSYRVGGDRNVEGLIVVAESRDAARSRVHDLVDSDVGSLTVEPMTED